MCINWQIDREIARLTMAETTRAATYAHRSVHRRPLRGLASAVRWVSEWLNQAASRTGVGWRPTATPTGDEQLMRADPTLSIIAVGADEDASSEPMRAPVDLIRTRR
jgi:hypothetical protein